MFVVSLLHLPLTVAAMSSGGGSGMRQHPTIRNGEAGRGACTPESPAIANEPLLGSRAFVVFFNSFSFDSGITRLLI